MKESEAWQLVLDYMLNEDNHIHTICNTIEKTAIPVLLKFRMIDRVMNHLDAFKSKHNTTKDNNRLLSFPPNLFRQERIMAVQWMLLEALEEEEIESHLELLLHNDDDHTHHANHGHNPSE